MWGVATTSGAPFAIGHESGGVQILDRRLVACATTDELLAKSSEAGTAGDHEGALREALAVLQKYPEHPEALFLCAEALHWLNKDHEGLEYLERLLRLAPDHCKALFRRGMIRLQAGEFEGALADFVSADASCEGVAVFREMRGVALLGLRRCAEAAGMLSDAIDLDPGTFSSHYNLGVALLSGHDLEASLVHFDNALRINPDHTESRCNRAIVLEGLGQSRAALDEFSQIDKRWSDNVEVLASRGLANCHVGDFEEAIADYNRVVEIRPRDARVLFNRACVYSLWGKKDEAIADLRTAVDLDGKLREWAREEDDFETLRLDKRFLEIVR
jgi:tetratricopeptide (TPR) repeat protein